MRSENTNRTDIESYPTGLMVYCFILDNLSLFFPFNYYFYAHKNVFVSFKKLNLRKGYSLP